MTNAAWDRMIIRMTKKQTLECPLYFEVRLQVDLGGHQVGWREQFLSRERKKP
jgi:hypothetical protein